MSGEQERLDASKGREKDKILGSAKGVLKGRMTTGAVGDIEGANDWVKSDADTPKNRHGR